MNVFDLQAKLGLNTEGFDKALSGAGNAIKGMASTIGSMVKVGVAGFSAVSAGVAAISKSAIDGYADYEQLVGGVDTLFKDSSQKVQEYAANAYKTAGMSANEYMETVTSFSASLLQSLDGDTNAAAEKANMAITDMSDNANKMGTSMEAIQNAYNGFAKQNYTMLDNLKLGYGGTAAEMERLIQDAEKIDTSFQASRDENGKLTMSYGEIVDAIHIVQTNMDITGTTAKEAASTISGSVSMMKASWENLLVGVADDSQDFDRLVNEFVDSVDTVAGNMIPRVQIALEGVGKLVEKLVPTVLERLPDLIMNTLPTLMESAGKLIQAIGGSLVDNLPYLLGSVRDLLFSVIMALQGDDGLGKEFSKIIETFGKYIPQITQFLIILGTQIFEAIMTGISDNSEMLLETLTSVISSVVGMLSSIAPVMLELGLNLLMQIGQSIIENLPSLIDTAVSLVQSFAQFMADNAPKMMPQIVDMIFTIIEILTDPANVGLLVDSGIVILNAIVEGFINSLPVILEHAPAIIENIVTAITENLPKLLECAGDMIKEIVNGFLVNLPEILEVGGQILDELGYGITSSIMSINEACESVNETIKNIFKDIIDSALEWGKDLIDNFIGGVKEKWENLKGTISDVAQSVKDFIGFSEPKTGPLSNFHTYAPDMMDLFASGIKENTSTVTDQLGDSLEKVTKAFDISPEISPIDINTDKLDKSLENASESSTGGVNNYYITVTSGTIGSDYDARRAAQIMSEELGSIRNFERMAVGG